MLLDNPNFLRDLLGQCLQRFLEEEFRATIGAERYERSNSRTGYRNGSYPRTLNTRVGRIELQVCRDRDGVFQTELFQRYQRNEKALATTMVEMYLKGVSTRKVTKVVEELYSTSVSKSQISDLTRELDESLNTWRNRSLERAFHT